MTHYAVHLYPYNGCGPIKVANGMTLHYYVAMRSTNLGQVIRLGHSPTTREDPDLPNGTVYVVGPFRTKRAALICASGEHAYGIQSVAQFERLARKRARA